VEGKVLGAGEGGQLVFSVLCWEENSIYDQGLYGCVSSLEITIITGLVEVGRLFLTMFWIWQIALLIFATGREKKGRHGRCKGDFFGKIGSKSPLGEKTKSLKYFYFSLWRLVKFDEVLLCMLANPPTSQIWKKWKRKKKPLKSIDGLYSGLGKTWLAS
jgi:hypothetical protein